MALLTFYWMNPHRGRSHVVCRCAVGKWHKVTQSNETSGKNLSMKSPQEHTFSEQLAPGIPTSSCGRSSAPFNLSFFPSLLLPFLLSFSLSFFLSIFLSFLLLPFLPSFSLSFFLSFIPSFLLSLFFVFLFNFGKLASLMKNVLAAWSPNGNLEPFQEQRFFF